MTIIKNKRANIQNLCFCVIVIVVLSSCGGGNKGQLTGVQGRPDWFQADPLGMVYIPSGSFQMGPSDQDAPYAQVTQTKTVSIAAFYMDDTEISNNEYRQFVSWVRDSLAHLALGGDHVIDADDPTKIRLNWSEKIKWDDEKNMEALDSLYLPVAERFYRRKEIDTKKLNFVYYWIDLKEAARKATRDLEMGNGIKGHKSREAFIKKEIINVYPDTLTFVHDYTYSFNDPMTQAYFWHPAYDDYPVVGVNWKQATAFCMWRTQLMDSYIASSGDVFVQDFRLPTEAEWEYASRGGNDLAPFPWGGPYIRNSRGCFLGNFKPMRGDYQLDGGFYAVKITSYWPNDYGLFCMSGNVAEWTSNAYDESSYSFTHDLNTNYVYDAKESDPPSLKRKVIRGGSWKDIGYYLQTGTRTFEYQDTAKCYIGFRCVMSYLGRDKSDN
jgi:sulfatase modifying factor 1